MAANAVNTVEYFFATRRTQLATNTTLATATRHDTAAVTLYIPETTSRNFLSVRLVATYHSEYAATNTITGWRMGIKLGAAATSDTDRAAITGQNVASKNVFDTVDLDVTSYFNTNFGAGASQTCVASLAVSTTTAENINNITFALVVTYEADFASHPGTRIKTVRLPLQSMAAALTVTQQELGLDGTNPAPANQIPALDTWLPEASKTYRSIVAVIRGQTGSTAATNWTPYVQLDGAAEVGLGLVNETLFTTKMWQDHYDLAGMTTNAVHALKMRADLTARLNGVGADVVITYEYDEASTTTIMVSRIEALTQSEHDGQGMSGNSSFSTNIAADANVLASVVDIQEDGVTLKHSAIKWTDLRNSIATNYLMRVGSQAYRTLTPAGTAGEGSWSLRTDHSLGWAIARGVNRLTVDYYSSSVSSRGTGYGYVILNYTATKPSDSIKAARSLNFWGASYAVAATQTVDAALGTAKVPKVMGPFKLSAAVLFSHVRVVTSTGGQIFIGQRAGELDAKAFVVGHPQGTIAGLASVFQVFAFTRAFNADSLHTGRLDIETDRRIVRWTTAASFASWSWWVTAHRMTFTVAGAITVAGAAVAAGKTVQIWAYDSAGVADLVTTVTTTGGGAFTAQVPDNTRSYFASYDNDGNRGRSALATPA